MTDEQVMRLANDRLVPLFSGVGRVQPITSTPNEGLVTYADGITSIKFKQSRSATTAFKIYRRQGFKKRSSSSVNEFRIIDAFVAVANELEQPLTLIYSEMQDIFSIRMISTVLASGENELRDTIISVINQLDSWSRGTYEGRQHAASIVVDTVEATQGNKASTILREPYYAVLSNGYDTAIRCSKNGYIIGHTVIPQDFAPGAFAPYRLIPVARWATSGRICFTLNRKGEILIFKDQQLCFARRCGHWHFLTHESIITQIRYPVVRPAIRQNIYETCLDASFSGTGACIGIVLDSKIGEISNLISRDTDILAGNTTQKGIALNAVICGRSFTDVERLVRMELAAIDGAMLIDEHGTIISIGTILNIQSGSDAGGRLAAAIALSELGVGIKVSQDGGIRGFHSGTTAADPIFTAM